MGTIALYLLFFVISIAFCALFSFLETAITSLRLFKLKELAQNTKYKRLFDVLEKDPNRILNTILIANNLANVTAATISTYLGEQLFSSLPASLAFLANVLLTTAVILIFGEIVPKNIARIHGERLFESTLWITQVCFYILQPFVRVLMKVTNYIMYFLGTSPEQTQELVPTEKEIEFMIDYIDEKGLMEEEKTSMLQSIFELGKTQVKEIMVPAPSIIALASEKTVDDAYQVFTKHPLSRVPVYKERMENIIGVVHMKDLIPLLKKNKNPQLKDVVRSVLFIPESMKVNQLLKDFKKEHQHMAMVINEYGGIAGLVTLEDVLEEIVGEIHDEYEAVAEKVMALKPGGWLADASVELDDLTKLLKVEFETEDALTLAGFLTEHMQHLPRKGERYSYKGYVFQIQKATPKKVAQVLIFEQKS